MPNFGLYRLHYSNLYIIDYMNIYSQFLRLKQVKEMTCLSKSSIYRLMEEGDFPRQVPLGARSVVWVKSQVEVWMSKKVAFAQGSRT